MNKMLKPLIAPVLVAIVLNLVLPLMATPFATPAQIKPPNGAAALPFFDQLMHMLVHHAQVPLTSSMIVALIVAISVCVASKIKF